MAESVALDRIPQALRIFAAACRVRLEATPPLPTVARDVDVLLALQDAAMVQLLLELCVPRADGPVAEGAPARRAVAPALLSRALTDVVCHQAAAGPLARR